jgi:hypothetical protein
MRGLFGLALLLGAATTLVDAGYYGLKLSEFEITKAGPGKVRVVAFQHDGHL